MIRVAGEDEGIARLQLGGNGLLIVRTAVRTPEMRAWDDDGRPVFLGGLCQRRHAAEHHGHVAIASVIVTVFLRLAHVMFLIFCIFWGCSGGVWADSRVVAVEFLLSAAGVHAEADSRGDDGFAGDGILPLASPVCKGG